MWIIPKQLQSNCAPDTQDFISDLNELSQISESSLLQRSKPMPSQTWFRKWKQGFLNLFLFGRILKPSTHASFTEKWTSSLEDTLVKDFPSPEKERARMILAFYGLTCSGQLSTSDPLGSSSKTLRDTHRWDSPASSAIWKNAATTASGIFLQRQKLARLTAESVSSSSDSWPTPMAHDSTNGDAKRVGRFGTKHGDRNLNDWAMVHWPAPTTQDTNNRRPLPDPIVTKNGTLRHRNSDGEQSQARLSEVVNQAWPTPTVCGNYNVKGASPTSGDGLETSVKSQMWATPRASESENRQTKLSPSQIAGMHGMSLAAQVHTTSTNWSTPQASDGEKGGPNMRHTSGDQALPGQVHAAAKLESKQAEKKLWTTPTTDVSERTMKYAQGGTPLAMQVAQSNWPTPTASTATWGDMVQAKYAGTDPNRPAYESANNWDTPTANDAKNSSLPPSQAKRDGLAGQMLDLIAGQQDSDNPSSTGSLPGSSQTRYVLNPAWCEILMGIPVGWTQITESTDCE